jgi:hypothetical protein
VPLLNYYDDEVQIMLPSFGTVVLAGALPPQMDDTPPPPAPLWDGLVLPNCTTVVDGVLQVCAHTLRVAQL